MQHNLLNEQASQKDLANKVSDDALEDEPILASMHQVTQEEIKAIDQAWLKLLNEAPSYFFYHKKTPEMMEFETLLKYSKPVNINPAFPTQLINNIQNPLKKLQVDPGFYLDIARRLFDVGSKLNLAVKAVLVANPHHIFSWLIQDAGIEQLVNLFLYKIDNLINDEKNDLIDQQALKKTIYKFIMQTRGKNYSKKRVGFMRDKLSDILTQDQIDAYQREGFKVYYVEVSDDDTAVKPWPKDLTQLTDAFVITQENAIILDQASYRVLAILKIEEIPNQKATAIGEELNNLRPRYFQDGSLRNRGRYHKSKAGSFSMGMIRPSFLKANKISQVEQNIPKKSNIRQLVRDINPSLNATFATYLPKTYQASLAATKKFAEANLTLGETSPHTSIAVNKTSKSMPCHRDLNQINFGILVCFQLTVDTGPLNTGTCFLTWKIQDRTVRFNLNHGDMLIADFSYPHCVYDDELGVDTEAKVVKRGSCVFYTHQNLFPTFKIFADGSDVEEMPSLYTESAIYTKKNISNPVASDDASDHEEPTIQISKIFEAIDETIHTPESIAAIEEPANNHAVTFAAVEQLEIPISELLEDLIHEPDSNKRKAEVNEETSIETHIKLVRNKKRKQACNKVLYLTDAVQNSYQEKLCRGIIPTQGCDQWVLVLKESTDTLYNEKLHENAEKMLLTYKDLINHRRNMTYVAVHPATQKAFDHMPQADEPVMLVQRAQLTVVKTDWILVRKYNEEDIRTASYDDLDNIESDSTIQFMRSTDFLDYRAKYETSFKKTTMKQQVLKYREFLLSQSPISGLNHLRLFTPKTTECVFDISFHSNEKNQWQITSNSSRRNNLEYLHELQSQYSSVAFVFEYDQAEDYIFVSAENMKTLKRVDAIKRPDYT